MSTADPTSDEILRLPPGGGAVASSGTDFDIDMNTGTAGLSLPLALPAGPNGVKPDLTLRYHSGAGADWLGLGWSTNLPRVTMRAGLGPGGDTAQPALDGVGPLWPRVDSGWAPEVDNLGQRILGGPDNGWRLYDLQDTVHALGGSAASRVTDATGVPVAWLLDSVTDSTGNAVAYAWEPSGGTLRPATVSWGRYQVRFVYEQRPDKLTDGSLGVLLTIGARVAVVELHRPDLGAASLLRSWHLGYDDAGGTGRSLLTSVAQFAHAEDGTTAPGSSVRLRYTGPGKPSMRVLPRLPFAVRQTGTQFVDLDGDGLPDLLDLSDAAPRWWRNTGGGVFTGPHRPRALPSPVRLDPAAVAFADADGDGAADLLVMTERFSGYYPLDAAGASASSPRDTDPLAAPFGRPVRWRRAPSYRLDDPRLRLLDLDGDGRSDLLVQSGPRWLGWLQDADAGWSPDPVEIPGDRRPDVDLGDPRVAFADVNGDGGLDVVRVTGSTLTYWPALGPRRWGAPVTVPIPQAPPRLDPRRVLLVDVDGDGCSDLVYLDDARVLVWRWCGADRLSAPAAVPGTPPTGPGRFRLLDLDGTGTPGVLLDLPGGRQGFVDLMGGKPYLLTEIGDAGATTVLTWRTSTRYAADDEAAGQPWRTFHPFPVQCVASTVTTNAATGAVSTTRYRYHEARYDPVARAFLGFGRVDRDELGDRDAPGGLTVPTRRTTTTFHLGLDPADPTRPLTGDERLRLGALRRKPLTVVVSDPDADPGAARPENIVRYSYDVIDRLLADGRHSLLPHGTITIEERWEGNDSPVSIHTVRFLEIDGGGVVTRQRSIVQRTGQTPDRDVTLTRSVATGGTNLRLACRTREVDADGTVLADSITYFDGPGSVGLPLGAATEGLVSRIEDLVLTDDMVTAVWGPTPPDLGGHGYHRLPGETGWWVARSRLSRDPAHPDVLTSTSPLGAVGTTELDPTRHDVVAVTDALGHRRSATYDARTGNVTKVVDFDGGVRHESFDTLGRVTGYWAAADPDGAPIATWSYDTAAMPVKVTSVGAATAGDPSRSVTYLDGGGAALAKLLPTGDAAQPWLVTGAQTLNARGLVATAYMPYPASDEAYAPAPSSSPHSTYTYDLAGRLLTETRPDGTRTTWTRGPGTVTVALRPSGTGVDRPKERHLLDACGQVLSVQRWDGARWVEQTYTWDHRGRPLTVTTPDGATHALTHDLLGRMICHDSPDSGRTRRLVDAVGNEVRTEIATGDAVTREFDAIGRPAKLWRGGAAATAPDVTWEYLLPGDAAPADGERHRIGRLWRVTDPLGTLTLAYDAAGRVVSKARSGPHLGWEVVTDAEYDRDGHLTAVVLPASASGAARRRIDYSHDAVGRPSAVAGFVDGVDYDVFGRTSAIHHANGVVTALRYDAVTGQVLGQRIVGPSGEVLRDQSYTYDDEHRLTGLDAGAVAAETGWSYGFDGLGRLASASPSTGSGHTFSYSDGGNILSGPTGLAQTYLAGSSRLASVDGQSYAYDAAGRVISAPWGAAEWDAEDHLLAVTASGSRVEHAYDHAGQRIMSRRDGVVYHLRVNEELAFFSGEAALFVSFAGAPIATVDGSGAIGWLHPDVLGDVTLVTDASGAAGARVALDPWGNRVGTGGGAGGLAGGGVGPDAPGTGFLGVAVDPTGLLCLGHRWYDPRTGRFLSPDPLAGGLYTIGAWNAYSYGLDNPVLMADPSGLTSIWAIIAIAVVVALIVVLAVATCGAALAGVTVLGVTFAAGGASAGTLVAVGIGAFGGALAGAMSADKKGGDVMLGALVGGIIGGACALVGGAVGGAVTAGMKGCATWAVYALSGAAQGAIGGFGSGLACGWAGGKGSLGDMMLSATRGMIWGATIGMVVGGFLGGKFASDGDQHSYLEIGTFHKYGLGFAPNSTDVATDFDIWDNSVGTAWDAGLGAEHALNGNFSVGGDVLGNIIDVSNVRNVGSDMGLFTTDIPGTLFAVDVTRIANVVALNGGGAGLASLSVGADVAGFSYADQVLLLMKNVPILGNLVTILDDFGSLNGMKKGFNTFYGSADEL